MTLWGPLCLYFGSCNGHCRKLSLLNKCFLRWVPTENHVWVQASRRAITAGTQVLCIFSFPLWKLNGKLCFRKNFSGWNVITTFKMGVGGRGEVAQSDSSQAWNRVFFFLFWLSVAQVLGLSHLQRSWTRFIIWRQGQDCFFPTAHSPGSCSVQFATVQPIGFSSLLCMVLILPPCHNTRAAHNI